MTPASLARFQMLLSLAWGPSEAGRSGTHQLKIPVINRVIPGNGGYFQMAILNMYVYIYLYTCIYIYI